MKIAIYCGSSFGNNKIYNIKAKESIEFLSTTDSTIVYGGSKAGLMGTISQTAISLNMEVIGVITHDLAYKEIENTSITKLYKVDTIRQRKEKMEQLSDAFIAFPGGFGTFEEISEIFTYIQIGLHKKPCALYNVNGYYNKFLDFLENCVHNGFISQEHLNAIIVSDDIEKIYNSFENYSAPKSKWELEALKKC